MTQEKLNEGWRLREKITNCKESLEHLEKVELVRGDRCSRNKDEEELAVEKKIRDYARNVLNARLHKLELQFKKL